jgi:hypothetical protein
LLLPFVLGTGVLWGGSALLLVVAFVRARRRGRRILERWATEDARADARAAVLAATADNDKSPLESQQHDDVATPGGIVVFLPFAHKRSQQLPN